MEWVTVDDRACTEGIDRYLDVAVDDAALVHVLQREDHLREPRAELLHGGVVAVDNLLRGGVIGKAGEETSTVTEK